MSIEQHILDSEFELMLDHLALRSKSPKFDIGDIEQELHHLLVYQGQDWVGRGEMKGINTPGQGVDPGGFASRAAPRGEVSNLTFPALARESRPFHGPSPLASFGNQER